MGGEARNIWLTMMLQNHDWYRLLEQERGAITSSWLGGRVLGLPWRRWPQLRCPKRRQEICRYLYDRRHHRMRSQLPDWCRLLHEKRTRSWLVYRRKKWRCNPFCCLITCLLARTFLAVGQKLTKATICTGTAFREIKGKLYPSVGLKKSGEHIRVNFGQTPFVFDIDGYMKAR